MADVANQATLQRLIDAERLAQAMLEAAEVRAEELIRQAQAEAASRLEEAQDLAQREAQHRLEQVRQQGELTAAERLEATEQRVAAMQLRAGASFERAVQRVVDWVTAKVRDA